jgi:hypothetical protein
MGPDSVGAGTAGGGVGTGGGGAADELMTNVRSAYACHWFEVEFEPLAQIAML